MLKSRNEIRNEQRAAAKANAPPKEPERDPDLNDPDIAGCHPKSPRKGERIGWSKPFASEVQNQLRSMSFGKTVEISTEDLLGFTLLTVYLRQNGYYGPGIWRKLDKTDRYADFVINFGGRENGTGGESMAGFRVIKRTECQMPIPIRVFGMAGPPPKRKVRRQLDNRPIMAHT